MEEVILFCLLAFCAMRENDVSLVNNRGSQRNLLHHIEQDGPSVLIKPTEFCNKAVTLGLVPLFIDVANIPTGNLVCLQNPKVSAITLNCF